MTWKEYQLKKQNKMEEIKHWAESLKSGDRVKATIRHQTDGSLNRINVPVIVIAVFKSERKISCYDGAEVIQVPFNELKAE